MLIHRALEDDWPLVRDVRLRALRENPDVFASSLPREESFKESHWRMRIRTGPTWVALDDERVPRGLVSMIQEPGSPVDDRHVVSLWVAPEVRRRGIGWALLDAVREAAAAEGARTVSLWIVDGNNAAGDLYVRAGFARTGERQPLPRDPSRVEERWVRTLDGSQVL
ncbi:GNAT family N-acetyltransferase [Cellulomonas fimi]|uniref:GCN5-related N-acetyltransferase n=1 Tax=Cellulomonas fimi (strain ATCC 484 / DSM 20113 / JCM 1341 / CCUG 24087 / LMG 16345 / NBRC 15513 / NCIMB 8980 / NCTC 7547 / NRS-133) TaxID=590998 RepID=F4GZM7_CELFA|nr:GNAT family N-acetyltransferase [Cellulomonas fimi]AEE46071.1 GCN5-related N-acetyltransferase [Cellulomonas fimi ATCC 484]NNH06922.1 GNAT family N-acetyltransferase [Cellulomonas fimi]VEH31510.1 Predicted acetyltransferase [Cellulomonas fimi]